MPFRSRPEPRLSAAPSPLRARVRPQQPRARPSPTPPGFTPGNATPHFGPRKQPPQHQRPNANAAPTPQPAQHRPSYPRTRIRDPAPSTPQVNFAALQDVRMTTLHRSITYPDPYNVYSPSEPRLSELSQASSRTVLDRLSSSSSVHIAMWLLFIGLLLLAIAVPLGSSVSSGLLWGNVLSSISLTIVILHFSIMPKTRRHPNQLLFWRSMADGLFTFQLLAQQFVSAFLFDGQKLCDAATTQCGCATAAAASPTCHAFAGLFEFALFAAEGWYLAMMVNLYWSLSNPFADLQHNNRVFHRVTWGTAAIMGLMLALTKDYAGSSDLGICWTNTLRSLTPVEPAACTSVKTTANSVIPTSLRVKALTSSMVLTGGFFTIWIAVTIVTGMVIWTWTWRRLRDGAPKSLQIRAQSIQRAHVSVTTVTIYWVIVIVVYSISLWQAEASTHEFWLNLLTFVVAGKGFVNLVIWLHVMYCADRSMGSDEYQAMAPQMNAALQEEVVYYTTTGIKRAVEECRDLPKSETKQKFDLEPPSRTIRLSSDGTLFASGLSDPFEEGGIRGWWRRTNQSGTKGATEAFYDYYPHSFRAIRALFGVTDEAYIQSILEPTKVRLSEGASGAFMFFTTDKAYIVKSMTASECKFLCSIAPSYAAYLADNQRSLLARFYGCHCLKMYGSKFYFVVMSNLFNTEKPIHYRYDIKGSTIGRRAQLPKVGEKATCRNCNQQFVCKPYGERDNCPVGVRGSHEPEVVLKDLDMLHKLRLDEDEAADLFVRLKKDADQLQRWKIMDYSLLLGIHEGQYFVSAPSVGWRPVRPNTVLETEPPPPMPPMLLRNATSEAQLRRRAFAQFPRTTMNIDTSPEGSGCGASCSNCKLSSDAVLRAKVVVGPMYYYVGIIDILQTWTFKKRLEHFFKVWIKRADRIAISAIPVDPYHDRFVATVQDILDVRDAHIVEDEPPVPVTIRLGARNSEAYREPFVPPPDREEHLNDTAFFV